MSDAPKKLQAAVVTALEAHPALANTLTGIFDGPPPRAAYPYISVADGVVSDWSSKTEHGREIRISLTVWDDGEEAARLHDLMAHVEDALDALPSDLPGWRVASNVFLRSLVARDAEGPWAGLVEQRIRLLST
ncbi:MAG: DUF3168 domain-containing protein [Sphingorhabdus sp.]